MRFRYFKNHYAYAVYEEDEILMYIDRQGNLFNRINMTKPFGTIYHAYKAFYHFRLKDNNWEFIICDIETTDKNNPREKKLSGIVVFISDK
mgnify:CR=1 FL=1